MIRIEGRTQLWNYHLGHSCLHLRSVKSEMRDSTIDVVFKGVSALKLATNIDDLKIEKFSWARAQANFRELYQGLGALEEDADTVYMLTGKNFTGYIVALVMFLGEDHSNYDEPSLLWDRIVKGEGFNEDIGGHIEL